MNLSESMREKKFCILVLGWARPDFIQRRLNELFSDLDTEDIPIVVSIDGPRRFELSLASRGSQSRRNVSIRQHERNLGGAQHYFVAVGQLLNSYDAVIVIEDDVRVGKGSIRNLIDVYRNLEPPRSNQNGVIVSGFSPIATRLISRPKTIREFWYPTKYFNCWGHLIDGHAFARVLLTKEEMFDLNSNEMSKNSEWSKLGRRKRELWLERARRGTYDYIIQLAILRQQIVHVKPLIRRFDNEGIGDYLASHTKGERNRYWGSVATFSSKKQRIYGKNHLGEFLQVLNILDNLLMAQDSIFTTRGRRFGIRSFFRKVLATVSGRDFSNN